MSPKIHTPVQGFTGIVVGVDFKNGVGETEHPAALGYFERQGYTIVAEEKPKEPTERELLVAEAKELGLDAKGKNEEIKARIAEHKAKSQTPPQGDGDTTPPADGDKGGE